MWNATLPVPLDPADDSIFGAPPHPDWNRRQKRAWREKRKIEKLRDSAGDEVVQPGTFVGSVFGDTFAPASVQSTFDAGCIRLSSASKSQKHLKSSCLPLKLYLYWEQGWESAPVVVQQCAQKAADILEATPWAVELKDEETVQELLLPSDLHFYNKVRECCKPPMRADLIRLMLLHRQGGVWCDASNVLTDDLAWLSHFFDEPDVQLFAFTSPHQDAVFVKGCQVPLLESWFIACVPECRFVGEWLSQFKCALLQLTMGCITSATACSKSPPYS